MLCSFSSDLLLLIPAFVGSVAIQGGPDWIGQACTSRAPLIGHLTSTKAGIGILVLTPVIDHCRQWWKGGATPALQGT